MSDRPLTDLECVALGCLAIHGPCTAYVVRQIFARAPSARFSGSAGAIYPTLRRLEARGLVKSSPAPTGKRPASDYSITRRGRTALARWVRQPLAAASGFADDPFRTRMLFLDQLPPKDRLAFLDNAEACIREQAAIIDEHESMYPEDPWVAMAHDNARRINRARLRWIAEARRIVPRLA